MMKLLQDFPVITFDKIRYADTDRQGHVNNACFSTFLETGRVEWLYTAAQVLDYQKISFVIAHLDMDFLKEIHWPGRVEIGTGITQIGNSSFQLYQQLFQADICVAKATTTLVQINNETKKGEPISPSFRNYLNQFLLTT